MEWLPLIPDLAVSPIMLLALALFGLAVGYASGLFGVGGGFIITPLLISLFGMTAPRAVGAGVVQMIAVAITSARRHASAGYVDARLGITMAPGILLGTLGGTWLLQALEGCGQITFGGQAVPVITLAITGIFVVLLTAISLYLWCAPEEMTGAQTAGPFCWTRGPLPIACPASNLPAVSLASLLLWGAVLGVFAGMLGIGGGIFIVPILTLGFGLPLRQAIGTSSLLILFSAVFSTINHAYLGNVDMRVVLALLAGSSIGAQIGAWHSHRLHVTHLQRAFSLLIMLVVVILTVKLVQYFI